MIKEFEFYHGAVLSGLAHAGMAVSLKLFPTSSNSSYVINDKVGIFVKYSSKRMSPWSFSFNQSHQDEILEIKNRLGEVFLLLVCFDDGIVTLNFDELKIILNEIHKTVEWIRVSRKPREKYSVKGSDGKLKFKIGGNEFPNKIFDALL